MTYTEFESKCQKLDFRIRFVKFDFEYSVPGFEYARNTFNQYLSAEISQSSSVSGANLITYIYIFSLSQNYAKI